MWTAHFVTLPLKLLHLVWKCSYVKRFQQDILRFILDTVKSDFTSYLENILFGLYNFNPKEEETIVFNTFHNFFLAKFHVHKCKYSNGKPLFCVFEKKRKKKREHYVIYISTSNNKKAMTIINICNLYKVYTLYVHVKKKVPLFLSLPPI